MSVQVRVLQCVPFGIFNKTRTLDTYLMILLCKLLCADDISLLNVLFFKMVQQVVFLTWLFL